MSPTAISWTHGPGFKGETWNPTTGCDRISPGCDNCYALTLARRLKAMGQARYQNDGDPRTSGPGFGLTVHVDALDKPLHWRTPRMVFVDSMSDLFHHDVPIEFVAEVFSVMAIAEVHTFQVLTKRPQRMARLLDSDQFRDAMQQATWRRETHLFAGFVRPNVWCGVSVENDRYTWRADHLRATPTAVRFLSCEPLLGPLPSLDLSGIDWCLIGGESGPGARPMDPAWAVDLVARCRDAGVAVHVKQLGSVWGRTHHDIETWPEELRVREWPEVACSPQAGTATVAS